jgi:hypothetical protein
VSRDGLLCSPILHVPADTIDFRVREVGRLYEMRKSKGPGCRRGLDAEADVSGECHQMFGAMCQFRPALNWLMWVVSEVPNEAGIGKTVGRMVPLMATFRVPKSR